jgi:16S rRNA (guanine966-N2)-methyltransferase
VIETMPTRRRTNPTSHLRIISGQWRGRKLNFEPIEGLRPTGDRMRETLFNWLQFEIAGSRCLDLFAGSGALGFEALSRGAQFCQFIELNPSAANRLQTNLGMLDCIDGQVVCSEAIRWLDQAHDQPFDLVFCDPPFNEKLWAKTIQALAESSCLRSGTWVYIEAPKQQTLAVPGNWRKHRSKVSGSVCASLYQLDL